MLEPLSDTDPHRIGPFRLRGRIGEGGTGTVYLGVDGTGQAAAVKVLAARVADRPDYRRRFQSEADAARQLGSARRVARFLGDGQDTQRPWMAFEYVPGVTLAEAVRPDPDLPGRPLPRALLPGLALGLAQALAEVHERRVVHRDLKPSNIALSLSGPTVIDFGMALLGAEAVDDHRPAEAGPRIGTPYWMAPEHHVGAELGPHTDVFSWGSCLAYAIFGSWRSREDALAALAAQESDGGQDLMSAILRNVVAATDREPTHRPSAADVVAALRAAGPDAVRSDPSRVWTLPLDLRQRTTPESAPAADPSTASGPGSPGATSGAAVDRSAGAGAGEGGAAASGGVAGPLQPVQPVQPARSARSVQPVRSVPVAALAIVAFAVMATGVGLAAAGTKFGEVVGPMAAGNVVALLGLLLAPSRFVPGTVTAVLAGLAGAGVGLVVARLSGLDEPLRVVVELAGAAVVVSAVALVPRRAAGPRHRPNSRGPIVGRS